MKRYVKKIVIDFCQWLNWFSFWIQNHILRATLETCRASRNLEVPIADMDQDMLAIYIRWHGHHVEKTVRNDKRLPRGGAKPILLRTAIDEWYRRGYPCRRWLKWADENLKDYKKWDETGQPQVHHEDNPLPFQPEFPIMEVLINRVSSRFWKAIPVADEIILKVLEAAAYAPSSCNRQPWKLYVSKNFVTTATNGISDVGNKTLREKAPVIIYITIDNRFYPEIWAPALDAGIIGLQLSLAATALGLGGCLMYGCENFDQEKFRRQFNVPPYRYMHIMYLLGYPAERTVTDKRLQSDEIAIFV